MKLNLKIGALLLIFLLIIIGITIWYYCHDLPSLSALEKKQSSQIIHINYQDQTRLINHSEITDNQIEFYQIPWQLINAVVLTEDRKFFSHLGIDIFGIIRAYLTNFKAGKIVQGGSTITQQLAKMLFLQPEKTLKRKIQEAILAMQIEQYFTKQQIITFYLNRAYFGSGNYGVKQASNQYFNKSVNQLNLFESAMLAGILKAPSKISPKNNFNLANQRAKMIVEIIQKNQSSNKFKDDKNFNFINQSRYYFSDLVLSIFNQQFKNLKNKYEEITINSTIDFNIQSKLENKLNQYFNDNQDNISTRQVAVMITNYSGEVLAMVGGKNYQKNRFNHVIDNSKSIGNMIDNFIYLSALESGIKIDDVFVDQKINYHYPKISAKNSVNKFNITNLTLNNAFINSSKSISQQLIKKLGEPRISEVANKLGIENFLLKKSPKNLINLNDLSQVKLSLFDLITFFSTIANNGFITKPYLIKEICDHQNHKIFQYNPNYQTRLLKKSSVEQLKKMLKNNIQNGDHKILNLPENIYGKITHNQNQSGYWAVGFDQKKIIGIWIEEMNDLQFKNIFNEKNFGYLFASLFNEI